MHCRLDMEVAVNQKRLHQSGKKTDWHHLPLLTAFFSLCLCACPPEGQPDPYPHGEGDQGGVGPVPAALRPLHALHPGGRRSVGHFLLRAPALAPTHEGEASQSGD